MDLHPKVTQLLVSRVCHDLAGGVSAVSTGTELLAEEGESASEETVGLIAMSAAQTAARLQFLRVAFGAGGGEGSTIGLNDLKKLTHDYLEGGRVSLLWDPSGAPGRVDLMAGKLLLNLALIASEGLPRGGVVEVTLADYDGQLGLAVAAQGTGARLNDDLRAAINVNAEVETLTPRTVHGHFCAVLAGTLGAELEISLGEGAEIHIAALLPRV